MLRALLFALVFLLFGAAVPGAAQAPDRSAPPLVGPPPPLTLPEIREHALTNGLRVWIVEMHEVPVVQIGLVVNAGSAEDPSGRFGLANMTAAMLDEGAAGRSALEIADAIDFLGAQLSAGSSFDVSLVRLGVPVARLADALPIFADVALRPDFPAGELSRLQRERLVALLQARDDPDAVANHAFPRLLFGAAHRYGVPEMGTPDAISAFTPGELRAFHAAHFAPDNSTLIVVGDVTPDRVIPPLEAAFGKWTGSGLGKRATLTSGPRPSGRRVYIVDKPDAAQSEIRVGAIGVPRSTPDYFPLRVLNTVLGGSFTARLNQNLREEHGYSYGAYSMWAMRRFPGPFVAVAAVQTDKTAEALHEFFVEIDGIREPVPSEELDRARNYVALGMPAEFETTGDVTTKLQELVAYGLARDYFAHYVSRLRAVTAGDVARVAREHIRPERMVVVVVGDSKVIEPGIRALKLGRVTVLSVDETLGPAPRLSPEGSGR